MPLMVSANNATLLVEHVPALEPLFVLSVMQRPCQLPGLDLVFVQLESSWTLRLGSVTVAT